MANQINKTGNIRTYDVTSWQKRLHFTPPGLLRESDIISFLWKFHVDGNNKMYLSFNESDQYFC